MIYGIKNRIFNQTALSRAAFEGHAEIVELLLSQDAIDINCKDIYMWNHS